MQEFAKLLPSGALISGLFPAPVYKKNIDRSLTDQEKKISSIDYWAIQRGSDNSRSSNTDVLSKPSFFSIKQFLSICIEDYVTNIIAPQSKFNLYITQSWINFNKKGDSHHQHYHANSILSGVLYLHAIESDLISFHTPMRSQIHIVNKPNWWNMKRIGVPIQTGDVILFQSNLEHGVEQIISDDHVRVSLSFNTWFKGELGSENGLTKLAL